MTEVLGILRGPDFALPTRLPAWNVKELVAHVYRSVNRLNVALAEPAPPSADHDSVTYWRSYDPTVDSTPTADRAIELAATFGSGRELVAAWEDMVARGLDAAAKADRNRVLVTWGLALALEEFLKTCVLEVTVHGLDLARALDRPPWATPGGSKVTTTILLGLLGQDLPAGLEWNDVTFMEKGTGRIPLDERDRLLLGFTGDRFPLLG